MAVRTIIFRGKRFDGKWVEGGIFIQKEDEVKDFAAYIVTPSLAAKCNMYEVHPETVGQYIGLKDKNGKRIFEGDIVKAQDDLIFSPFCDGLVGKIVYIEAAFFIEPKDPAKSEYLFNECAVYEVLGNIHDNGELMEDA